MSCSGHRHETRATYTFPYRTYIRAQRKQPAGQQHSGQQLDGGVPSVLSVLVSELGTVQLPAPVQLGSVPFAVQLQTCDA